MTNPLKRDIELNYYLQKAKEKNNENKNNIDNNINIEKEERRLSFNKPLFNFNNNNFSINFNNINIGEENKIKPLNKQKIIENYEKEKYNSENLNENLNINEE